VNATLSAGLPGKLRKIGDVLAVSVPYRMPSSIDVTSIWSVKEVKPIEPDYGSMTFDIARELGVRKLRGQDLTFLFCHADLKVTGEGRITRVKRSNKLKRSYVVVSFSGMLRHE